MDFVILKLFSAALKHQIHLLHMSFVHVSPIGSSHLRQRYPHDAIKHGWVLKGYINIIKLNIGIFQQFMFD